jgi:hypothetical protein
MDDRSLLALCAAHSFAFAAFHLGFWTLFDWREQLPRLSPANRAILPILNLRLIYVFVGIGALCLAFPAELATTPLGRALLLGMAGFWLGRLIEQFVYLPLHRIAPAPARVRRGMIALTSLFALGVGLFAWPALR